MKTKNTLIIAIILISQSLLTSSCFRDGILGISGSGPLVTEEIYLNDVSGIDLSISGDVIITKGNVQEIRIEAQQNILNNIRHKVRNEKWIIEFDRNVRNHDGITIFITVPEIDELDISGSGSITSNSDFSTNDLELRISGSGSINFVVDANSVYTNISGSGSINLLGSANKLEVHISGSGQYSGYSCMTSNCDINISGSGKAKVFVQDKLDVNISGSGNIYYKGYPSITSNISGSGSIRSAN